MIAVPLLIKVTAALVLGLAAAIGAPRARASVRHLFLACTFGVLAGLPVASALAPNVTIEVPVTPESAAYSAPVADAMVSTVIADVKVRQAVSRTLTVPYADVLIVIAWGVGTLLFMLPLATALGRVRHLRRTAVPWDGGRVFLRRPDVELLLHEEARAPLTCGVLRPAIILPIDAPSWSREQLARAFTHELEHIHRGDWWMQVASRATCAVYWFHPLAWVAWRRLALEAERACDDAVLRSADGTGDGTGYAEQLVTLARRLAPRAHPLLSMAGRSDLSARVRALLNPRLARGRAGLTAAVPVFVLAALFVAIVAPLSAVAERRLMPLPTDADLSLFNAAERGRLARVRELIADGANPDAAIPGDGSPLIAAARNGHFDVSQALLDAGADPNLAVPGDGNPLIMAALNDRLDIAGLLLDRGADVNAIVQGDETPLINASAGGHLDMVRLLVDKGADVNLGAWAGRAPERPNDMFRTPLNMAERGGHQDVVNFLRSRGATR
ncbi:MAG: M56 family metallopeptidase [Vicinamibacterales bacterium]